MKTTGCPEGSPLERKGAGRAIARRSTRWPDLGAIVADGHSVDRTVELAACYVKAVSSSSPRADQTNAGPREASGEVLWFVHADATFPPTRPTTSGPQSPRGMWVAPSAADSTDRACSGTHWLGQITTDPEPPAPTLAAGGICACRYLLRGGRLFGGVVSGMHCLQSHGAPGGPDSEFVRPVVESLRRLRKGGAARHFLLSAILSGAFELGVSPWFLARFRQDFR